MAGESCCCKWPRHPLFLLQLHGIKLVPTHALISMQTPFPAACHRCCCCLLASHMAIGICMHCLIARQQHKLQCKWTLIAVRVNSKPHESAHLAPHPPALQLLVPGRARLTAKLGCTRHRCCLPVWCNRTSAMQQQSRRQCF